MITGTVVRTIGKGRFCNSFEEWNESSREDEPRNPEHCSEKDGLIFMWQREHNSDKKWLGPWTLTTRPAPEKRRGRLTERELEEMDRLHQWHHRHGYQI